VIPLLLAGPILRRTDARSVAVWVAFSKPGVVGIRLWEGRQKSDGAARVASGDAHVASGGVNTRRLGEHLHVAVVTTAEDVIDPGRFKPISPPLRPGAIYCYDIVFTPDADTTPVGLRELGVLADDPGGTGNARTIEGVSSHAPRHLALGYAKDMLPSFATGAASIKDVRLAHASCRKAHGPGPDALSWIDQMLADSLDKPDKRIQQLFLTGDQIYADDVPTCLLPMLHDLAVELMGDEEELDRDNGPALASLANAPPMRRAVLVRREGGFTSVEAQNHLLTFGEYAAMYLIAWSTRAWRELANEDRCYEHVRAGSPFPLTNLEPFFVSKGGTPPAGDGDFRQLVRTRNAEEFAAERQRVIVYAATVAKVARALANVPTYMIFDDHDVTDDWNLNATWRNRVLSRPAGRTIVREALLSYTYFQAWGSDWRSFVDLEEEGVPAGTSPNLKLLDLGEQYLATTTARSHDATLALDLLFGLRTGGTERAEFHYEAPGSLYQVRVLDTRTRRSYPFATGVAPAFLLGSEDESVLDEQLPKGPRRAGTPFVLIVTSTPALGPELLERMLVPMVMQGYDAYRALSGGTSDFEPQDTSPGAHESSLKLAMKRTEGAMFVDTETWPSNEAGLHQMLGRAATYESVIFLGGDVHYGTNIALDWYSFDRTLGESSRSTARLVQLTSSAARNAFEKRIEAVYQGYHWLNQWFFGWGFEGFAWKDGARLSLPSGAKLSLLRHSRMKAKPALLPAYGWPQDTRFEPGDEPDWSWRVEMARDERPDAERSGPFAEAAGQLEPDIAAAGLLPRGLERARALAAVHQKAHGLQFAPRREAIFTNNVGVLTFELEGEKLSVIHTQHSSEKKDYPEDEPIVGLVTARPLGDGAQVSKGLPLTVVKINLTPTDKPRPTPHTAVR
jgi:hypothetical protein